ncbi:MAG: ankyrin repeat domain-containing protein [Bacteroidota bacterium]
MKKTVVILAIALGFSFTNLNATNDLSTSEAIEVAENNFKTSPLCLAVAKGDIEGVKKLIELGENVNKKSNGMLPIHYAAKYNRTEIMKLLITAGSEIYTTCDKGLTPLRHAELSNATEAARLLKSLKRRPAVKRNV